MMKVNGLVLWEASEQCLAQSRKLASLADQVDACRHALAQNGETFAVQMAHLSERQSELMTLCMQMQSISDAADLLATVYTQCERELSRPNFSAAANAYGAALNGDAAENGYVESNSVWDSFREWIRPLVQR